MNAPAQLSEAWFKQRVGKITGSRVGAILGLSPFSKPDDVMREMVREYHGADKEFTGNQFTRWGQEHEVDALDSFTVQTGFFVAESALPFVTHKDYEFLGASPDGLADDGGLIECKCPQKIKELEDVPHYVAQMQLQMHCSGNTHCWFVQWTTEETRVDKVIRDDEWIEKNLPAITEFNDAYLKVIASEELSQPYLEAKEVIREDESWNTIASELKFITGQIKNLQDREKELKKEFISLADGMKSKGAGISVFPTYRKSVDYKSLVADLEADIKPYEKESSSWTVRVSL